MIELLGQASILFVVLFTWHAAKQKSEVGGQSMKGAITETWVNIFIGFQINYVMNLTVLPVAGIPIDPGPAFWVGCVFTAVSILRQFFLRRFFNWLMHLGIFR